MIERGRHTDRHLTQLLSPLVRSVSRRLNILCIKFKIWTRCLLQQHRCSPNLIKIRSMHLLPIFYRFFLCLRYKNPIENREQVRRSNFN
jgi:hypothetical protein